MMLGNMVTAHSVCPLPRKRGRVREGACKKIKRVRLPPPPSLPRKRGREQTAFVASLFAKRRIGCGPGICYDSPAHPF